MPGRGPLGDLFPGELLGERNGPQRGLLLASHGIG